MTRVAILVSDLRYFDLALRWWPATVPRPQVLTFRQNDAFHAELRARGFEPRPIDDEVRTLEQRSGGSYGKYTLDAPPDEGFACKLAVPLVVEPGTLYMDHDVLLLRDPASLCKTTSWWSWDYFGICKLSDTSPHAMRLCTAINERIPDADVWPVDYNEYATDNGVFYVGRDFDRALWLKVFDALCTTVDYSELPPSHAPGEHGMSIKHRGLRAASFYNCVKHRRVVKRPVYWNLSERVPKPTDVKSALHRGTFLHYAAGKHKSRYVELLEEYYDVAATQRLDVRG